jgi:hypothetical protein
MYQAVIATQFISLNTLMNDQIELYESFEKSTWAGQTLEMKTSLLHHLASIIDTTTSIASSHSAISPTVFMGNGLDL